MRFWLNGETAPCCRRIGHRECRGNDFRGKRHYFNGDYHRPPLIHHGLYHAVYLAHEIRKVYEKGQLPLLERFSMLQDIHPVKRPGDDYDQWEIRDVVSNTTSIVGDRTFPTEKTDGEVKIFCRDGNNEGQKLSPEEFSRAIEPGTWLNAANGSRYPPSCVEANLPTVDGLGYFFDPTDC